MTALAHACRPHRGVLEALVERGERGPAIGAALDHLETCATCERDLTELALTVAALRRAGRELRAAPVPQPAPARVAALAVPRRTGWAWRMQLGGLLTGAAIAALIVVPRAGTGIPVSSDALEPARPAVSASWRLAEAHLAMTPDNAVVLRARDHRPAALSRWTPPTLEGGVSGPTRSRATSADLTPGRDLRAGPDAE